MMSSVMGNGVEYTKAKQIVLALGLFFSCSNLSAMCPQTVGAVSPGEGIWRVTSRVGEAMNAIQSQLCALSNAIDLSCTFTFGQADIGGGNIYTISTPGTYCMSENVTFSFGPAITVDSGDVIIDLGGHTIDGVHTGALFAGAAIVLENFVNNVTIQNGTIENITDLSTYAIRDSGNNTGISTRPALTNITIKDINFNNNASSIGLGVTLGAELDLWCDGVVIENCHSFGTIISDLMGHSLSSVIRGCVFDNSIIISRPLLAPASAEIVIEDCIISTTNCCFGHVGHISAAMDDIVIRNCIVQGPRNQGIGAGGTNVSISDCIVLDGALTNGNPGFAVRAFSGLLERCFVTENQIGFWLFVAGGGSPIASMQLIDCVANNNLENGFYINFDVNISSYSTISFERCSAQANGLNGFLVGIDAIANTSRISQIRFEGCIAQDNGADGFSLLSRNATSSISDVIFRNCVSQGNRGGTDGITTWLGDGFGIGSGSTNLGPIFDVTCQNCFAQNNSHDGFNFSSTVTFAIKVLDCCAMNNTGTGINGALGATNSILGSTAFNNGTDIAGVTDPTLVISRSFPGALAGSSRWVNAIS